LQYKQEAQTQEVKFVVIICMTKVGAITMTIVMPRTDELLAPLPQGHRLPQGPRLRDGVRDGVRYTAPLPQGHRLRDGVRSSGRCAGCAVGIRGVTK
jgi:hypothetical protein